MRFSHLVISLALALTALGFPVPARGATKFPNCTALNKVYPGGVALAGAKNKGGKTRYKPKFSRALYLANQAKDRDKDGIACER
jgi:hypothetical protein